jgi:rubrerythrin
VAYLESRLEEWERTGKVTAAELKTAVPSKGAIEAGVKKLDRSLSGKAGGSEVEWLQKALKVESEASKFYNDMVSQLPQEGKDLFARFVEIEEGHLSLVQAEIDYASRTGLWFDLMEFDLSGAD